MAKPNWRWEGWMGFVSLLPAPEQFLYAYVRKEAVASSPVEGTQSSLSDLLAYEITAAPGIGDFADVGGLDVDAQRIRVAVLEFEERSRHWQRLLGGGDKLALATVTLDHQFEQGDFFILRITGPLQHLVTGDAGDALVGFLCGRDRGQVDHDHRGRVVLGQSAGPGPQRSATSASQVGWRFDK
jgi:hypothetical protein